MSKYSSKLLFLVVGLTLAATASYLNAWSGPPTGTTPPDNNVVAPINVSAVLQNKDGVLGVGGLSVFGAEQISTTTYTAPSNLSLGVNGSVGAKQYCDENGQNCSGSAGGVSTPAGAIMAFNLATCPTGWIPADGTNGTRDLRGVFVRGMESFNGGTTASSSDPDRTGSATLGSYQADMYTSHTHSFTVSGVPFGIYYGGTNMANGAGSYDVGWLGGTIGYSGGNETRPKNVALLYCQKT